MIERFCVFSLKDYAKVFDLVRTVGDWQHVEINKSLIEFKFTPEATEEERSFLMKLLDSEGVYHEDGKELSEFQPTWESQEEHGL